MSTAADVITLDSSPGQPPSQTPARSNYDPEKLFGISPPGSSPPPLVSPSEMFRPPSRSRFFAIGNQSSERTSAEGEKAPNGKVASSENHDTGEIEATAKEKPKRRRGKATSEAQEGAATSTSDQNQKETVTKKPRATTAKSTEGPKKRGRPSKKASTDNRTLSGRVAKAGNVQTKETDDKTKCPSTPRSSSGGTSAVNRIDWEKEGLQLEAATKRRLDWTPTKDTMKRAVETDKAEGVRDSAPNPFGSLLADYNFNGGSLIPQHNPGTNDDGFITKRRRIELVDPMINPDLRQKGSDYEKASTEEEQTSRAPESKKKRQKKPKKLTTLTARVTAQYNNDLTESSALLSAPGKDSTPVQAITTKSKGKGESRLREPEYVVLSPEAATKTLDDQDLVFGTCSQLQREDSPTLLRETQAALLESEKNIIAAPASSLAPGSRSQSSSITTVSRFQTPRNLWSVAARDSEGSLAQFEVIDLSDSPVLPSLSPTKNSKSRIGSKEKQNTEPDVTADAPSQYGVSEPKQTSPLDQEPTHVASQDTDTDKGKSKDKSRQPADSLPQKPQYTGFTDAELSRQVAAYGFKAVKARKKMIELLEKCWEAQHGTSESLNDTTKGDNEPEPPTASAPSQSQTAGKGTRKATSSSQATTNKTRKAQTSKSSKSTTKSKVRSSTSTSKASIKPATSRSEPTQPAPSRRSFADIEEIQDSEDEAAPSPSRLLSRFTRPITEDRQTLPMSPTPTRNTTKYVSQPSAALQSSKSIAPPDLASQITKAVRAQSQSHTSSRPHERLTWHERMLLYDPIILEDFTRWLNTEGLVLVGEDREVGAGFVRQWCENRSICCCYR